MRVLIIEDEIRLAANIAAALRQGVGLAVDCAHDGSEGAALVEFEHYDLLLLDLMLPGPRWPEYRAPYSCPRRSHAHPRADSSGRAEPRGHAF